MRTSVRSEGGRAAPRWAGSHIREEILAAAARAFTRKGLADATVRDIAGEAGCTAAALYTYFKGKDQILTALREEMRTDLDQTFSHLTPAGLDFRQRLELLLFQQMEFLVKHREVIVVLRGEADQRPGHSRPSPFQVRLTEWIKKEAASGELGSYSPETAAAFLAGIGMSLFALHGGMHGKLDPQSFVTQVLDLFFHGVSGDASPRRAG